MYFTAALIASLAISANALATPHVAGLHRRHQHAALAKARAPEPVAAPFAQPDVSASVLKKQLRKRCKPRKSAAPTPSAAPVNVGADPASADPSVDSSSQPDKQTEKPSPASPPPNSDPSPSPSPAPAPAPAPKPKPKPQPEPEQPVTGGQSGSMFSGTQVGQGTFYGTGLGACGITNHDGDFIAAVSMRLFDVFPGYKGGDPNKNPVCGKKVKATYNGKSVVVTITDRCVGCKPGDLDFSPAAFNTIADPAIGRISGLHWEWL